ncbi:DUF4870 domain-containing protein [soil metagenome]
MMTDTDTRPGVAAAGPPVPTDLPAVAPTTDSRNLGLVAHLSALVAFAGVPSFIGPLVVWLLHRDRDNFVAEHAREALNFNLSLLIYGVAGVALSVLTIGLGLVVVVPLAVVAAVAWFAFTIMAALRASQGEIYHYPLTMRLIA